MSLCLTIYSWKDTNEFTGQCVQEFLFHSIINEIFGTEPKDSSSVCMLHDGVDVICACASGIIKSLNESFVQPNYGAGTFVRVACSKQYNFVNAN